MRFRLRVLATLSLQAASSFAQAQTEVPPASKPAAEPETVPTETEGAAPQAPDSVVPTAEPERLDVEDPMLVPVPPAKKILSDWRDALRLVKNQSPSLLRAHAQIEQARGQARMTLSRSLPTLTGNGSLRHQLLISDPPAAAGGANAPNPATLWNVSATLNVPLLSARNWYDYATAKKQIHQAALQTEDAERLIIAGLAEAIVTVVTTERLAEVTRVNLAAALSTLELNKRRARLGAGSALDVLRAKQDVARSRGQVIEADESLRQARERLGRSLGDAEPWSVTPDLKMDQLRADARNTCSLTETLDDRADLRAARAGAAIAERNVNAVKYSFLPTIDASTTYTYNSEITFVNFQHTTWTIQGLLTWRLYDGGLRYGEKQLNQALLTQRKQETLDAQLNARIEVAQATRGVEVARQSLAVAQESQSVAHDNAGLAKAKFINGTGTSFDMVDTQRTARQTAIDVTVKEFELLRAEIIAFLALATCKI